MNRPWKNAALLIVVLAGALVASAALHAYAAEAPANCEKTYANFGKAFLETYCTGCHHSAKKGFSRKGAPAGYDFDDEAGVKKEKPEILEWVVDKAKMPPGKKLSAQEKTDVKTWMDCQYK